jgi:hypothetical protein
VLVVGGRAADGAAVDDVQIYNVYTHAWQVGVPLPAPRARPIVGGSASGYAYVLGGDGPDGAATGTLWRYDTTAAPAGAVLPLVEQPALARAGEPIAIVRSEAFVVGGTPPVVIDGFTRSLTAAGELPSLAGGAATAVVRTAETEEVFAVFVGAGTGASGLVRLASDGVLDEAAAPASARRTGHAVVALGDERILAIGGAVDGALVADAVIASPGPRLYLTQPDVLATPAGRRRGRGRRGPGGGGRGHRRCRRGGRHRRGLRRRHLGAAGGGADGGAADRCGGPAARQRSGLDRRRPRRPRCAGRDRRAVHPGMTSDRRSR